MKHFISLGAGVQSSTMALMATHGEITPMPDGAIFADTQREPEKVYEWLNYLETRLSFPVYRVTAGDLGISALKIVVSKKSGKRYFKTALPVYGADGGFMTRACTVDYKIVVIRRELIKQTNKQPVTQWIGISRDEAQRMKDSRDLWITNRWPLIEKLMTRGDCFRWMKDHGYPEPPRSACYFCPFHSPGEWARLKREQPAEFMRAVTFENDLQLAWTQQDSLREKPFLHPARIPLIEAVDTSTQGSWDDLFNAECEGVCGV